MPKQALYLKWRPMSFDDMIGQEHITRALRNSLKTGRIRHAYLFSGPRGTGKTTSARLLAKALNCLDPNADVKPCNVCSACVAVNEGRYLDLIEIDAASHTSVDDVRDLRDKIAFAPGEGQYKVYIIDEVHRFSGSAFDALLKTLEEPPAHAIFILATTEIDKVPQTIKSRCLPFEFRRVSVQEVADRLGQIAAEEGLHIERGALELVARQGTGSVRDSISLLDQIVSDPDEVITLDTVQRVLGTANMAAVKDLVNALVAADAPSGLHLIAATVDSGSDPRQFGMQTVEHLRSVLLTQTASSDLVEASREDQSLYEEQAALIGRGRLLKAIRAFNEAIMAYKGGWQPQLALELAFLESLSEDVAPVMVAASASAPSPNAPMPMSAAPVEALPPGTPPVVEVGVIREKWMTLLRVLGSKNATAPDLVQYFHPLRVEGNVVYLVTDNHFYYDRIQTPIEKLRFVEWGLTAVHKVPLLVKVLLVPPGEMGSGQDGAVEIPYDPNDALFSEAAQLGAKISPTEQRNSLAKDQEEQ